MLVPWVALGALAFVLPACVCGSEERAKAAPAVSAMERAETSDSSSLGAVVPPPPSEDDVLAGHGEVFRASELVRWVEEVEARKRLGPADVEWSDSFGHTLLHKAAIAGRVDLARRLVALGADPNALSSFNFTPLDLIQQGVSPKDPSGIPELVEFLESIGGGYYFYGGAQGGELYIPKRQAKR